MSLKEAYKLISHITRTAKRVQFLQLKSQVYCFLGKMDEPLNELARTQSTDTDMRRLYLAGYKVDLEIYNGPLGTHRVWACRAFSKKTGLYVFGYEITEDIIETTKNIYDE